MTQKPIFCRHTHDELLARARSSVLEDDNCDGTSVESHTPRAIRSKHTKMQNNVLNLCVGEHNIYVFQELQPLLRKDGATIRWALVSTMTNLLESCQSGLTENRNECKRLRIHHMVVGNGVNTNENALKKAL